MFNEQFARIPESEAQFKQLILAVSLASIKVNQFTDNYDWDRYGHLPESRSMDFAVSDRVFWLEWFLAHHVMLYQTMSILSDDKSKSLLMNLIAYRIAGHLSFRIDVDFDLKNSEAWQEFSTICSAVGPSEIAVGGFLGQLKHFDFLYGGHRYKADCLGFEDVLFRRQYFLDEGPLKVLVEEGDAVIDGGACLGESAITFGKFAGKSGCVYAFDPIAEHLELVEHNVDLNPDCNVVLMPYGLSDENFNCEPLRLGKYNPAFNLQQGTVPLRQLDSLVLNGEIDRVNLIKLDVEGAELQALKGAAQTISIFRPKLAISLYHLPTDLFEIPVWINTHFPFYRLYIRHYTIYRGETVLYCSPKA